MKSVEDPDVLASLISRLGALEPYTTRRWGTLTPGEMLCHLGDCAASVLSCPGGDPGRTRPIYKWIALYLPIPWPHGIKTLPQVDPRADGTRPTDFAEDRRRAIEKLRALAVAPPAALSSAHSMFGMMTPRDWRRWAYRHTDHHLRQFGL